MAAPNVAHMVRPAPTVDDVAPTPPNKLIKVLLAALLVVVAPIFLLGSAILSRLKARGEQTQPYQSTTSTRVPIITGLGAATGAQRQSTPSTISRGGFGGTASSATGASGT